MQLKYIPNNISLVNVKLPASKSISNRALIMNALSQSSMLPRNLSNCDDTNVMLSALQKKAGIVDIGAAGTAMRFLTAYFSITEGERVLTGSKRMQERPISILVEALRTLGAHIEYLSKEGYPPLRIQGTKLRGGYLKLQGNVSSQYISALLLIAPMLEKGLRIELEGKVISKPYIDLTLELMQQYGAKATWLSDHELEVLASPYRQIEFQVESDWSAASYWYELVAMLPSKQVFLEGLKEKSNQGDAKVKDWFASLGVKSTFNEKGVLLTWKEREKKSFEADLINQPDLAQTFIATCSFLKLPFKIKGLQTLRIKETDRLLAMTTELGKMGYHLAVEGDEQLSWDGNDECLDSMLKISFKTYKDHRMAMSLAPAALLLNSGIEIEEPHVVSKSYPDFWNDLSKIGFVLNKN
jgi:3-phosphoshikimate 1-carboxyvinyltransferase